jgi:hypothetical protein
MGTYLYRRPAGTRGPDDTSHLGANEIVSLIARVLSSKRHDRFASILPAVRDYLKSSTVYRV